jgi:hypothetical protein
MISPSFGSCGIGGPEFLRLVTHSSVGCGVCHTVWGLGFGSGDAVRVTIKLEGDEMDKQTITCEINSWTTRRKVNGCRHGHGINSGAGP